VQWVDVFTRDVYRDIICDSLKHCQEKKGLEVYAYCMMTNHMHLIIGTEMGVLSGIVRDFKKFYFATDAEVHGIACGRKPQDMDA
jgi:putative transposase